MAFRDSNLLWQSANVMEGEKKSPEIFQILSRSNFGGNQWTNIAASGLDIDNVAHVINFDLPRGIDDYVHNS